MLTAAKLAKALEGISPIPYNRNVFRSVELDALLSVSPMQPLYDLGPRNAGQRFTPLGGPPALYVSEHPATSYFEGTGMFSSVVALAQQNAPATVILNLRTKIERVLDITVASTKLDPEEFETSVESHLLYNFGDDFFRDLLDLPYKPNYEEIIKPTGIAAKKVYDYCKAQGLEVSLGAEYDSAGDFRTGRATMYVSTKPPYVDGTPIYSSNGDSNKTKNGQRSCNAQVVEEKHCSHGICPGQRNAMDSDP